MRWRRVIIGCGCVLGALSFAGCATPGYNPTRLQSELVHAGTTIDEARCVTNALTDTFDEKQLGSHSTPTADEQVKTRAILKTCGVSLPLSAPS